MADAELGAQFGEGRPIRTRPGLSLDDLLVRAKLAAEIRDALDRQLRVASGPGYWGGVSDVLNLLCGADPVALNEMHAAARKERLGW